MGIDRRKRMYGMLPVLAVLSVCCAVLSMASAGCAHAAPASTPIDIFILAGQSNAAGYSPATGIALETYDNVWYAGEINKDRKTGIAVQEFLDFDSIRRSVTAGLGQSSGHIGPEYGMAAVFDPYYAGTRKALILKSAAGGTALCNQSIGGSDTYGNWLPPSLWNASSVDPAASPKGVQYENLVKNVRSVCNELKSNGYAPKIQGIAWMQGEADLGNPETYKTTLKAFISDLRSALLEITADDAMQTVPFVIGEIATTFSAYNNPSVPPFNEMQRAVADEVDNVWTVKTSDLIICKADGSYNGPDQNHFSGKDAETLGMRFGQALIEHSSTAYIKVMTTGNGKVTYAYGADGTQATLTVTPGNNAVLDKLTVDGIDVTDRVRDGTYTITDLTADVEVVAEFKTVYKYKITYAAYDEQMGNVDKVDEVVRGESLYLTVTAKEGFHVEGVTFGGEEMTYDAERGQYVYENVTRNGTVSVRFAADGDGTDDPPDENAQDTAAGGRGCGSALTGVGGVLLTACAAAACARKKKRI